MTINSENRWYVFYCKSRAEKKAFAELSLSGIEAYLPLMIQSRIWSDRIKKVQVPMFNGYIFVKCSEFEISKVLQFLQIVAIVKTGKDYSVIREKDIEILKKIESNGIDVSVEPTNVKTGDEVEIISGPLKGYSGICIEESGVNFFYVAIDGINQSLKVKIEKARVKKI